MTDKTDKKTETEKNVQVETTPNAKPDTTATSQGAADVQKNVAVTPPPVTKAPKAAAGGSGGVTPPPASANTAAAAKQPRSAKGPVLATAVVVVALAGATIWYLNQQNERHTYELEQQLQANIRSSQQANERAQQALSQLAAQQQRLQALEQRLASTQEQTLDLHQAFQTLTDAGGEVVLLNDIEHLVTIAQQQLLLGGNVANAIVSLETAQARLARVNRPTLASLQQTINGDVERLRAASTTDVASISRQLELLAQQLNDAPLLMPDDVQLSLAEGESSANEATEQAAQAEQTPDANASWWQRAATTAANWADSSWRAVRHDLGEFITIRRVDDEAALLMSPEQANRFRDGLRMRVSSAKLALMTNQPDVWKAETQAIVKAIEQRFDPRVSATAIALQNATRLSQIEITTELPSLDNSLSAIEALLQGQSTKGMGSSTKPTTPNTEPEQPEEETVETESAEPSPIEEAESDESLQPDVDQEPEPVAEPPVEDEPQDGESEASQDDVNVHAQRSTVHVFAQQSRLGGQLQG